MTSTDKIYLRLGEAVSADLNIEQRHAKSTPQVDLDSICAAVLAISHDQPIIYTAFDGDHFALCGHMRSFVLRNGCIPANPESILGYKNAVDKRLTKEGVLRDDLSVLRGCDQLWVFTEQEARIESLQSLAEGVVVEILFFIKRHETPSVYFVSPLALLRGEQPSLRSFAYSYSDCNEALHSDQRAGILHLANSGMRVDQQLASLAYHIYDPLDCKYADWLREKGYGDKRVPLVPSLAVPLVDLECNPIALGRIFAAWIKLIRIATYCYVLPPMDPERQPSLIATISKRAWLRTYSSETLKEKQWADYTIPKAITGSRWPLTKKEGGIQ